MSQESTNPKDRHGKAKPSMHLIPAAALIQESVVMGLGAKKYGPYNWRQHSVAASVYVSAAYRHLQQWFDGDSTDDESGVSHLAHARACLGILLDAIAQEKLVDDRPTKGTATALIKALTVAVPASVETLDRVPASGPAPTFEGVTLTFVPRLDPEQRVEYLLGPAEPHRTVYIAGPMRGYDKFNFPAFDAARDRFIQEGWSVISPADLDRKNDVHEDTVVDQNPESYRTFAERDSKALLSLKAEQGDAIAMLPGWERSTGAFAELAFARWLGLKVLDAETMKPLTYARMGDVTRSLAQFLDKQG